MQFQTIALTAILATAIALPLPDMIGHFNFKRQVPPDVSGAVAGAVSGITGAGTGGIAGIIGAVVGALDSAGAILPIGIPT